MTAPENLPAYVLPPPVVQSIAIQGIAARFPVRRVYCVGRNYAKHVLEMGRDPGEEEPFFFQKPFGAISESSWIPYPPATANLHHEVELVVALARGGSDIQPSEAGAAIYGYAVGCDLTRRDLQLAARDRGHPWEAGKSFDASAPCGPIRRADGVELVAGAKITLSVNGELRQDASLDEMIWNVPEIIAMLSRQYQLASGDIIFTGTPEGVGPLNKGDVVRASVTGLPSLQFSISV